MSTKITSLLSQKEIEIQFTDKPVTPWGGMTLFSGVVQQVGLVRALREALPFRLTSPNATDPVEIILAFMAGVLAGSRRLAHIERLQWCISRFQVQRLAEVGSAGSVDNFSCNFSAGVLPPKAMWARSWL